MDIRTIISRIHSLPESSLEKLEESLTRVDRPKGFRLTETGKVESNVFFLSEGIARAYLPVDGKEVTFWIGAEGSTLMSMKSFVNDEKGYETIELMKTPCCTCWNGDSSTVCLKKTFTLPTGGGSLRRRNC